VAMRPCRFETLLVERAAYEPKREDRAENRENAIGQEGDGNAVGERGRAEDDGGVLRSGPNFA